VACPNHRVPLRRTHIHTQATTVVGHLSVLEKLIASRLLAFLPASNEIAFQSSLMRDACTAMLADEAMRGKIEIVTDTLAMASKLREHANVDTQMDRNKCGVSDARVCADLRSQLATLHTQERAISERITQRQGELKAQLQQASVKA
jgi:hypothetical protein